MESFLTLFLLTTLGSVAGLAGGLILLSKRALAKHLSVHAIPFAAGVMLAVSFLDVLPESIATSGVEASLKIVLLVMVAAFFFEQFLLHLHHHEEHARTTLKTALPMAIFGDTIHNFVDGLAIAAAYLTDPKLGLLVAFATFAHEIPHEMGDFGLMIAAGWRRSKVILVNLVSALSTYLGVVFVVLFSQSMEIKIGTMLAIAGGLFLYIAASDLLPEVHNDKRDKAWHQALLLLLGVGLIWLLTQFLPD